MRILLNIPDAPIMSDPCTSKEAETRLGVEKLCLRLRRLQVLSVA